MTDKLVAFQAATESITSATPKKEAMRLLNDAMVLLLDMTYAEEQAAFEELAERCPLTKDWQKAFRKDVKETRKKLKEVQGKPAEATDTGPSPEEELKELRLLAAPLLSSPDLLGELVAALRSLGLAGQEREAKILYLAVTSRMLNLKVLVNVAVKGPSSGGKSFLVETVLEFFPASAFYALTAMSEKALAYSQEPVAHRFIIIYEAAGLGSDFAQYLMRSLLSEGRVRYETVDKTRAGLVPRLIEREGPTGLIVTTTRAGLHPENETRMLSLEVDDTPEQTMEVLKAQAKGENPKAGYQKSVDLAPFKALQRILELETQQAVVPFAETLALGCDTTAVRLRRDFPTVLNLVKAHAILHAHHREKDAQGRVIAILEDYAAVYNLVADLISYGTGQKVGEMVRQTVEAVKQLTVGKPDGVTYKEIGKQLSIDESAVRRRVSTAKSYLENRETRPRCAAKIVPAEPLPDDRQVLPHPKKIFYASCSAGSTADVPTDDISFVKTESYGRQSTGPTDCRPPTEAPVGSGLEEPVGGQAVGKRSAESNADLNHPQSQHIHPGSAGRHAYQGGMDGKLFESGELNVEEPLPPGGKPEPTETTDDEALIESGPVQCANCQHFTLSPIGHGKKGYCQLQQKSWNGQMFQPPDDFHPCKSFEVMDSLKVKAGLGEAVQPVKTDEDLKEMEL